MGVSPYTSGGVCLVPNIPYYSYVTFMNTSSVFSILKWFFSCIFCRILLRDVSDIVFRSRFMQLPKMNPSLCISSSMMVPEPWGRMWGTGVSFVAGYREVTYFLHSDPLCISAQLWLTLHPHPMTKSGNIQHKVPRGSWVAIPHGGAILQLMASWAGRANCFGECGSW